MKCSNCGLWNPKSAMWCDCDYEFLTMRVIEHASFSATPDNECKECALVNAPGAIWCLCGSDLRLRRAVTHQFSSKQSVERPSLSTLIDGVIMWMPFLLTATSAVTLALTVWVALLMVQVVLVSFDGQSLGTRIAGKTGWIVDAALRRPTEPHAPLSPADATRFAPLGEQAVRL